MRDYDELPGFEHLYLEDSWVLAVEETEHELRFAVEAVEGPPAVDASGDVDFGNIDVFR